MPNPMKQYNWRHPQRQPLAGLGIVFLNTFWEVLKRLWPLLLLFLFGEDKEGKVNRYEVMAAIFLVFTVIGSLLKFFYFRFYIEDEKLLIKKGWLRKETKVIPLEKIQSVHIEQGPVHQLFNIVKLSVDTAGSRKAEATIDAIHLSMAEALREQLVGDKLQDTGEPAAGPVSHQPLIQLTDKDLLKLSISANHLEAFFLLLSFAFGLYSNLKDIDNNLFSGLEDFLPGHAIYPILFLIIAILLITILVSTARIFFKYYNFTVTTTGKGFRVKSGLFNVKERLVATHKIQFVSWKANWIRKLLGLWLLEYHIASTDEAKLNLKMHLPVTQTGYIPLLVQGYYPPPDIAGQPPVHMHPSFITRRFLLFGLLPAAAIIALLWLAVESYALFFVFYPLLVGLVAWCAQRKFRLWALDDVLYIKKGIFGEERILLLWHKTQSIHLQQSIYQRRKGLANLVIETAGGTIHLYFIPLHAARQLLNFALYKTEATNKGWF
jgi:putative membrane protein